MAFIKVMRAEGLDISNVPRSQSVPVPQDRRQLEAIIAGQVLSDLVIMPCYPAMSDTEIDREARALNEIALRIGSIRTRAYANALPAPMFGFEKAGHPH